MAAIELQWVTERHLCACGCGYIIDGTAVDPQPCYTGRIGGREIFVIPECMAVIATRRPDLFRPTEEVVNVMR